MEQKVKDAVFDCVAEGIQRIILSNAPKDGVCSKCRITPVMLKGSQMYQMERFQGTQVFHENVSEEEIGPRVLSCIEENDFRQAELLSVFSVRTVLIGKRGTASVKQKQNQAPSVSFPVKEHNREKNYILKEGTPVPFLVDLAVMTEEGMIVKSKYDKFRQINRFLEFIEDILPELPKDREIRIIDFGCGKSYLTFALYYYLHDLKKRLIDVTGLDLKKDVIAHCSGLAEKYGYEKLHFLCGDIAGYEETNKADMVVTLHACDTATDYALAKAIEWESSVILSVPCCQHEWNRQMDCTELSAFSKYGIIKERMSALMTDAFRANVLEACGYKTQLLEFIDMEHTPKNILIRAVKKKELSKKERQKRVIAEVQGVMDFCKTDPTLYHLITESKLH